MSNLVYDDGDKFEINISYSEGDVHRTWLHPVMLGEVSDHLRSEIETFIKELKEK